MSSFKSKLFLIYNQKLFPKLICRVRVLLETILSVILKVKISLFIIKYK